MVIMSLTELLSEEYINTLENSETLSEEEQILLDAIHKELKETKRFKQLKIIFIILMVLFLLFFIGFKMGIF